MFFLFLLREIKTSKQLAGCNEYSFFLYLLVFKRKSPKGRVKSMMIIFKRNSLYPLYAAEFDFYPDC